MDSVYFHNYLFPHNEKRCYRNKLTFVGENTVYLGVTLKDKTNRHWKPTEKMIVDTKLKRLGKPILSKKEKRDLIDSGVKIVSEIQSNIPNGWPKIGNNAPVGYKHVYKYDGGKLRFKRPKLASYFNTVLDVKNVEYIGLQPCNNPKPFREEKVCCYCECLLTDENRTRDHVIPRSRGGKAGKNIKPCCAECNVEKGNMMLHTYIYVLNLQLLEKSGDDLKKLQTKIENANIIAKEI